MTFAKSLSVRDDMVEIVGDESAEVALKTLSRVIIKTPRDTGEAAGSWQVRITKPTRKDTPKERRAPEAQREGENVILTTKNLDYPTTVITSNKPYMERLNDGYSEQQPSGKFVELAIIEASR